jgi:hypothetical protein
MAAGRWVNFICQLAKWRHSAEWLLVLLNCSRTEPKRRQAQKDRVICLAAAATGRVTVEHCRRPVGDLHVSISGVASFSRVAFGFIELLQNLTYPHCTLSMRVCAILVILSHSVKLTVSVIRPLLPTAARVTIIFGALRLLAGAECRFQNSAAKFRG